MENYKGGFESLEVWKEARKFRIIIKTITLTFPNEEKYKLSDQLLRASRSITANIAEGYGRFHFQENIQFCRQARGSLNEVLDHLICAYDEKYIDSAKLVELKDKFDVILKLLNGYIAYLKHRKEAG